MKSFILFAISIILTINSIYLLANTNFNLGNTLVYISTIIFWIYSLQHRRIDLIFSHGAGRLFKYLFLFGCVAFFGISSFIFVYGKSVTTKHNEKAIIVLGAAVHGDKVSGILARRLNLAAELSKLNPQAYIVVSGGKGSDENISEALAMQQYLILLGVDDKKILMEDKSTSTKENFELSVKILSSVGIDSDEPITFVTNDFHCYRASKTAQKAGYTSLRFSSAPTNISLILSCYMRETLAVMYMWAFK